LKKGDVGGFKMQQAEEKSWQTLQINKQLTPLEGIVTVKGKVIFFAFIHVKGSLS
jgi:hypothetical protein